MFTTPIFLTAPAHILLHSSDLGNLVSPFLSFMTTPQFIQPDGYQTPFSVQAINASLLSSFLLRNWHFFPSQQNQKCEVSSHPVILLTIHFLFKWPEGFLIAKMLTEEMAMMGLFKNLSSICRTADLRSMAARSTLVCCGKESLCLEEGSCQRWIRGYLTLATHGYRNGSYCILTQRLQK